MTNRLTSRPLIRPANRPLVRVPAAGDEGGLTGININLDYAGTDWGGIYQGGVDVVDTGAVNIMDALSRVVYAIGNDFDDLTAGEYTSGSDYNQTILNGAPVNSVHWSKTAGANLPVWVKPSAAIDLDYIDLWIVFKPTFPTVTFFDQDNNALTPVVAPTGFGDAISSGSPNTQTRQMRWEF
jgi:hypothetical protein